MKGEKVHKKVGLFLTFAFVFAFWGMAQEVSLKVAFDPEEHVIYGTEEVRFTSAPGEVAFMLLANLGREPNPYISPRARDSTYPWGFDPSWTRIEGVSWRSGGEEGALDYDLRDFPLILQTYSLKEGIMTVKLPRGEAGTLVIRFRTRFPHQAMGEPGWLDGIHTWRFGWHPILLPEIPGNWEELPLYLPAYPYSLELSLPPGWVAALPGDRVTEEREGKGTVYHVSFARTVRSISLYIAEKGSISSFELAGEGPEIQAWYLPGDEDRVRALATYIPEILSWYGERFGPYPHKRLLLVEHPNTEGTSFAADGVVYLSRWYFSRTDLTAKGALSRAMQYVLAHELAHQWWGIGIGVDFDRGNWLSEGMAQYLSISWFEDRYGAHGGNLFVPSGKGLGEELLRNYFGFVNLREHLTELPYMDTAFMGFDEAVVKPSREVRYHQEDYERLYDKGYLVLRALAHYVGEDTFYQALREARKEYAGGEITPEAFEELLEKVSGKDLKGFFADWVLGDAVADYRVLYLRVEPLGEGRYRVRTGLEWRGSGSLPVEVEFVGEGDERKVVTWNPKKPREELSLELPFPPRRVILDPGHYVLDTDRSNNAYPRRFRVIMGRNDLPLDAYYLVVLDPMSGAVSGGYLDRFAWAIYPGERLVAGRIRYGRTGELFGIAQAADGFRGRISWTQYLWHRPATGFTGEYWERAGELKLGVLKLDTGFVPFTEIHWHEGITAVRAGVLSLHYFQGHWRLWARDTEEVALAPRTYLDLSFGFGRAYGMPAGLDFGLDEFITAQGRGYSKVFLGGQLWLPPLVDEYSLGGALLLSRVDQYLFLHVARLNEGPWVGEGGMAFVAHMEALGGLFPVTLVGGLVVPLLPQPNLQGLIFFYSVRVGP